MLSAEQQETLTRVGRGTPMGGLLRRYWWPVAASCELTPGQAKPVRLLGEELLLFVDKAGRRGLVSARCPHRGTSLARGCIDEEGLRCPYHGWKFDVGGRCLELPAEPPDSPLRSRVRLDAWPTEELGGLVFAYLGPEPAPLLPRYAILTRQPALRDVCAALLPCNWLQIMENSVDPHHTEWLHGHHLHGQVRGSGREGPSRYRRRHVKVGFERFRYGIIKRRLLEGGSEEDDDWKVGHPLVFPATLRVGAGHRQRLQYRVPVDDTTTLHLWYSCYTFAPDVEVPPQEEIPLYAFPWRAEDGSVRADTVDGGDILVWLGQGAIADRTREQLGASDRGIVLFRRMLFEQLAAVARGEDPLGVVRDPAEAAHIELPQEFDKFGDARATLAQAMDWGHGRFSPLSGLVRSLWKL